VPDLRFQSINQPSIIHLYVSIFHLFLFGIPNFSASVGNAPRLSTTFFN